MKNSKLSYWAEKAYKVLGIRKCTTEFAKGAQKTPSGKTIPRSCCVMGAAMFARYGDSTRFAHREWVCFSGLTPELRSKIVGFNNTPGNSAKDVIKFVKHLGC